MNGAPGRTQAVAAARWLGVLAAIYATALTALYLHGAVPRHRPESAWFATAAVCIFAAVLRGDLAAAAARGPEAAGASPWRTWVALVGLSLAAYAGIIGTGLLSDDFVLIERAAAGRLTMGNEFYRPLPFLIWRAGQWAGEGAAPLLHLTNIVVHGVNACLVLALARALGLPWTAQVVAAVVFVLHAAGVEAVAWISAFPDVLAASGTLVMVLGSVGGSPLATGAGLLVALLSKESGVAAPVIAIVVCWAAGGRLRLPVLGLGATAVFVVGRLWFLPLPDEYVSMPSKYVLKELVTRTIGTLAAPWSSGELAMFGWLFTAATCTACLLIVLANARSASDGRLRLVVTGMAWAMLSVAPVFNYLFISEHMEGSRYLYLGGVGWALVVATLVAGAVDRGGARKGLALLLAVVVAAGNLLAIQVRQQAWRDAADRRDEVLDGAARVLVDPRCVTVAVTGLPDQVRGAFVFRNGFPEAMRRLVPDLPLTAAAAATCVFSWTSEGFQARAIDR